LRRPSDPEMTLPGGKMRQSPVVSKIGREQMVAVWCGQLRSAHNSAVGAPAPGGKAFDRRSVVVMETDAYVGVVALLLHHHLDAVTIA
jgi:hypothetical protein